MKIRETTHHGQYHNVREIDLPGFDIFTIEGKAEHGWTRWEVVPNMDARKAVVRALSQYLSDVVGNTSQDWDAITAVAQNETGEVGYEIAGYLSQEVGDTVSIGFGLAPAVSALLSAVLKEIV